MAFKGASQSVAMQRAIKRTSDEGIKPAPWAIVAFRVGKDNVGRERVYRRIWSFRDKNKAASAFYRPARGVDLGRYDHAALLEHGRPIAECGDPSMVARWCATRRGANKAANPYSASTYMHRECRGPGETYMEEGSDLRHLARPR